MSYKRRVVSAAVLGMKNEHQIEDPCFKLGELSVRSYETQEVLGSIVLGERISEIETLMLHIVSSGHISVSDEHGKSSDELNTLSDYILDIDGIGIVVV